MFFPSAFNVLNINKSGFIFISPWLFLSVHRDLFLQFSGRCMEVCRSWPTRSWRGATTNTDTSILKLNWQVQKIQTSDLKKKSFNHIRDVPSSLCLPLQDPLEYITMAALSKIFAVVSTYPYQVIRARLQDQHTSYKGVLDVVQRTWRWDAGIEWNILGF